MFTNIKFKKEMEKIIKLTELRKLNAKVSNGDISALQMVEMINESAFKTYVLKMEKLNNEIIHLQKIIYKIINNEKI